MRIWPVSRKLTLSLCLGLLTLSTGPAPSSRYKEADQAWDHRKEEAPTRKAYELYKKFYEETPDDPSAAWRFSMISYHLGIRYTTGREEKKRIHKEGIKAGEAGFKLDPKCAACYFWAAINIALYGEATSPLQQLISMGDLKHYLAKTIELDPKFAQAGAYRLYGRIYHKLPGIFGGDNAKAIEYFEKAIQLAPDEPLNFLFYAEYLADQGQTENALKQARKGLAIRGLPFSRMEGLEALDLLKVFVENQTKKVN